MSSNLDIGGTFNVHHKLRSRECVASKPGAHVHRIRNFYESVLPNHTVRFSARSLTLFTLTLTFQCVCVRACVVLLSLL